MTPATDPCIDTLLSPAADDGVTRLREPLIATGPCDVPTPAWATGDAEGDETDRREHGELPAAVAIHALAASCVRFHMHVARIAALLARTRRLCAAILHLLDRGAT